MKDNKWAQLLTYVTGMVNQRLLLQMSIWLRRIASCRLQTSYPSISGILTSRSIKSGGELLSQDPAPWRRSSRS